MELLLDTHCLIWALDDPAKLSPRATVELRNPANQLIVSAATIWEIAIKVGKGNLSLPYRAWFDKAIADLGLRVLPIALDHAERQVALPFHHRDPFDRLLAAQALTEGVPLVSGDALFDPYGVARVWD